MPKSEGQLAPMEEVAVAYQELADLAVELRDEI